jgi:hypothetical protein
MATDLLFPGMKPPFDRSQWERQKGADTHRGPLLIVEQVEHGLNLRRQAVQNRPDGRLRLLLQHCLQRAGSVQARLRAHQVFQCGILGSLASALSEGDTLGAMTGNGIQPAGKFRRVLQPGQSLEGQQKSLLGHIFGRLSRSQALPGHHQDSASKAAYQFIVSLPTAQLRDPGDFGIAETLEPVLHCHASVSSCPLRDIRIRKG